MELVAYIHVSVGCIVGVVQWHVLILFTALLCIRVLNNIYLCRNLTNFNMNSLSSVTWTTLPTSMTQLWVSHIQLKTSRLEFYIPSSVNVFIFLQTLECTTACTTDTKFLIGIVNQDTFCHADRWLICMQGDQRMASARDTYLWILPRPHQANQAVSLIYILEMARNKAKQIFLNKNKDHVSSLCLWIT